MSELLDERVVEMRFDNADFEQNVNQSIKTINKLKESLDFENAGESFENISAAAAKCDISPLEESLETVTVKFDMLEMVAANVLGRIVNRAIDAGAKLVKSLTIDQLSAGWSKYDQKTQAVQTIIAATGASIDVINDKLEKLIWYADETSYDFVDMVNNIGKFTSAGIELDDAVDSMMGISNWAAQSGAGIQQASRAMYNLSQAIGMGYVGIQDWKSIELANMATLEFKQTVIETALELGTLQQSADGTIKTLDGKAVVTAETMRDSLKKQWFTSDVLTSALTKYNDFANKVYEYQELYGVSASKAIELLEESGEDIDSLSARAFKHAQEAMTFNQVIAATSDAVSSGWMRTFELIFGNYEQAKKLWTSLANDMWDVFAGSAEHRNDILKSVMSSEYQNMIQELPDGSDFEYRLTETIKEIGIKNGKTAEEMERLFSRYDSLEELLKTNALADYLSNDTLAMAFSKVGDEYAKDGKAAAELSKKLQAEDDLLKNVVIGLANGWYGKDEETARKKLESMGWTDFEYLVYLADLYNSGEKMPWSDLTDALIKSLDEQKSACDDFVSYISKLDPFSGFFDSLRELGGREKLIGGFQNIIGSFKNFYLLLIEIKNGLDYVFHIDSLFSGLISFFYDLTSIFGITGDVFEVLQESVYDFFHGGIQKKWNEFWYGKDLNQTTFGQASHIPGMLENISDAYYKYIATLPANTAASLESIRTKIFGFFSSISTKFEKWKEDIFGKKIEVIDATDPKNVKTYFTYTGGLINEWKEKITKFFLNSLPGKAVSGLVTLLQKITNYLFGYETETEKIDGKLAPIFDKVTAFINMLKSIGKKIHDFLFGKDFNQTGFGQVVHIPGMIEKIRTSLENFASSEAFQSVKRFFFGEKDADGKVIKKNIFGKIGTAIEQITRSEAYKSIYRFIFGEKDADGKVIKNNIFGKIGTAIEKITGSEAYKSITRFIFGEKDADGKVIKNNIFGKIGTLINFLTDKLSELRTAIGNAKQNIKDLFGSIAESLGFDFNGEENGINIVLGIFDGIIEGIKNVRDWIKKHIFDPFVEGFKNVFGIHSPAEEMKPLGEKIFLGILSGILNVAKNIGSWIKSHIYTPIKNAISERVKQFLDTTSIGNKLKKIANKISDAIELLKSKIKIFVQSEGFKTAKRFFLGEKDAEGNPIKKNIFGKIGTAVDYLKSKLDILVSSDAFQTVKRFIFGEKDADGKVIKNNIFGKIGTAIEIVRKKAGELPEAFLSFFLGPVNEEGKRTENLFKRLPEYFQKAKTGIEDFFLGKKIHKGTVWSDELNSYIPLYEREGNLIDRLKDKFEKLKADHPWLASFCSFIETQIQNISKIFSDANGNLTLALENLNSYLFGGKLKHKDAFGNVVEDLEETDGAVTGIRKNIEKLFNGGKEKESKSFLEQVADILGIGRGRNIFDQIRSFFTSLTSLNIFLLTANFKLGDFMGFEIQTGLEALIDSFQALAVTIAILAGTLVGLTIFVSYLQTKGYKALAGAFGIIILLLGAIAGFTILLSKKKAELKASTAVVSLIGSLTIGLVSLMMILLTGLFLGITGLLAKFNIVENHKKELIAAGAILVILLTFITLITAFSVRVAKKDEKIKSASGVWFGMAAVLFGLSNFLVTVAAVVGAFYLLTKNMKDAQLAKLKNAGKMVLGIIGLAFALVAVTAVLSSLASSGKNANKTTFAIVTAMLLSINGLIVTISLLLAGLYLFTKNKSLSDLKTPILILAGILLSITAMVGVLLLAVRSLGTITEPAKKSGDETKKIDKSVFGLLLAIMLMIERLKSVVSVLAGVGAIAGWENLAVAFGGIALLLLSIAGVTAVIAKIKGIDKSVIGTIGTMFMLIAAIGGLIMLIIGLSANNSSVSNIDSVITPLAIAIGEVILLISAVSGLLWFLKANKVGETPDNVHKALINIGIVLVALGAVTSVIYTIASEHDFQNIHAEILPIMLAMGEIAVFAAAITLLLKLIAASNIEKADFGTLGGIALSLAVLAAVVAGMMWGIRKLKKGFNLLNRGKFTLDFENAPKMLLPLLEAIGELVLLMIPLSVLLAQLKKVNISWKDPLVLGEMIAVVFVLAGAAGLLAKGFAGENSFFSDLGNWENAWKKFIPLMEVIAELAVMMTLLSVPLALLAKFKVDFKTPLIFLEWAVVLGVLAGAIALIISQDKVKEIITQLPALESVAKSLIPVGAVLGALILGIMALMVPMLLLKKINPDWNVVGKLAAISALLVWLSYVAADLITTASALPSETNFKGILLIFAGVVGFVAAIGAAILIFGGVNAAIKKWPSLNFDWKVIGGLILKALAMIAEAILVFAALGGILKVIDTVVLKNFSYGIVDSILFYVDLVSSIGTGFIALIGSLAGAIVICGLISAAANNFDSFKNIDFGKVSSIVLKAGGILAEMFGIFIGLSLALQGIKAAVKGIFGVSDNWLEEAVDYFANFMNKFSGVIFRFGVAIGLLAVGLTLLSKIKIPSGGGGASLGRISAFIWKAVVVIEEIILAIAAIGTVTRLIEEGGSKLGLKDGWIEDAFDFVANLLTSILGGIGSAIHALVDNLRGQKEDKPAEAIDIGTKLGKFMDALKPFLEAIRSLSLSDLIQVGILSSIMVGIFTSEFFEKAAEWAAGWETKKEITDVVGSLGNLFGEGAPLTKFLAAVSELTAADINAVNMLSDVMKAIFESEFYQKAAEWVAGWETGTTFDDVLKDLGTLFGTDASLTVFLGKLDGLTMKNVSDAKALTSIMKEICGSLFFEKAAEWISKWKTGTDFKNVLKDLGSLFSDEAPLPAFLDKLQVLSLDSVVNVNAFTSIMFAIMSSEFFKQAASLLSKWKTGGDFEGILKDFRKLFGDEAPLTDFLANISGLTDATADVNAFTSIMFAIMSSEFFKQAASLISVWKTGGDFEGILKDFSKLFGDEAPLTDFLTNISGITDATADVNAFTSIMFAIMSSEFFKQASTLIESWKTGTSFDDILIDFKSLFGEQAPLTEFLGLIEGLSAEGPKNDMQALSDIMQSIFESVLFEKAASWVAAWNTDGGDLTTVLSSLGAMVGEQAPLTLFLKKLEDIDETDVTRAGYIPKILSAVFSSQLLTGGAKLTQWISDSTDYVELFNNLTKDDGVIDGIAILSTKLAGLKEKGIDISNIGGAADAISSVFGLLKMMSNVAEVKDSETFIDKMMFWKDTVALDKVGEALSGIKDKIITKIVEFQEALKTSEIDDEYIRYTIGTYLDLINTLMTLGTANGTEIDISNFIDIGNYVVKGLILALSDETNTSDVKKAAVNLGLQIKNGLMFALDEHSPSKVAYQIGQFVAQGLTNGLLAGEPLTWNMARQFGEGTAEALIEGAKKYDSYGLTEHAINMVTADLLDENIFNMPDFSYIDRFGNEVQDFEKMADFLKEKFGDIFSDDYIDSFIGASRQAAEEASHIINDEDYAKLITGIGAGEFGLSENTIIDALTAELGSVDAARLAWQDFNDVREGTLKINQDLLKQQKQNPPMTLEQYIEMMQKEEENYRRVMSGEFDTLAAQNGTTRYQEMEKAGLDAKFMQMQLDREFSPYLRPMTREEKEAYIYAREQERYLAIASEENSEAARSAAEANNELAESLKNVEYDVNDIREEQKAVRDLTEATSDYQETVESVTDAMETKNESMDEQTDKTAETADAAEEAAEAQRNLAGATRETANARSVDYKAANAAITAIKNGTAATEEELAALKALQQETATYGIFDVAGSSDNRNNRKAGWLENGISAENVKYFFGQFDVATVRLDKVNAALKTTESSINGVTEAADNAVSSTGTLIDGLYDRLPDTFKSFTDAFVSGYDAKKGSGIKVKVSDIIKFIPDGIAKDFVSLVGLDKSDMAIDIPVNIKIPEGADVKDYISAYVVGMFSDGTDAANTASISFEKVADFFSKLFSGTSKDDLKQYFENGKKAVLDYTKALTTATDKTNELNKAIGQGSGEDYPQIDYTQEYMQQVDETVAAKGYKKLEQGLRVNKEQAAELQKVWYNAVQGSYGSDFTEYLKENFGIDWDELNKVITPSGNFNPDKVNPYLDYAESLLGNEDYKTENLFQDILDGKFGSDKDRKEAVETLGYDYDKIQDQLNKYRRGEMTWDELVGLGDSYGKVTDEEKKYAEEHEKLLKTLNTTPEGAFRSIADFLEGVTSVLKDPDTSSNFTNFINEIVGSLQTIELSNASQFEIIGNFLTSVRNAARESTGIVQDFKTFVEGIQTSLEKLGQITIENPEGMEQVTKFLNSIEIENKETLDTVASFIGSIVSFAEDAAKSDDYADELVATIGSIVYAINTMPELDTAKTDPLTKFLTELTTQLGILENNDDSIVQVFLNNFYSAFENSTDKAKSAAASIAKALYEKFQEEISYMSVLGWSYVWAFSQGMLDGRKHAIEAAEAVIGSVSSVFEQSGVDKASGAGQKFVSGFVSGLNSEDAKAKVQAAMDVLLGKEEKPFEKTKNKRHYRVDEKEGLVEETVEEGLQTEETEEAGIGSAQGTEYGQNFIAAVAAAIQNGAGTVQGSITDMFSGVSDAAASLGSLPEDISTSLKDLATTIGGILEEEGDGSVTKAVDDLKSLLAGIAPDGYAMGKNTAEGIVKGLADNSKYVAYAMKLIAKGVIFTFDDIMKIQSPSKVMYQEAGYVIEGLVNGLHAGESNLNHEMGDVAGGMIDRFSSVIAAASDIAESEMNLDPVITPVVDLSNVYDAANDIDSSLSTDKAVNISTAEMNKYKQAAGNSVNESGSQTFIQNNYSPKALSRLEIYRQTKNQFAMMKGAYNTTA